MTLSHPYSLLFSSSPALLLSCFTDGRPLTVDRKATTRPSDHPTTQPPLSRSHLLPLSSSPALIFSRSHPLLLSYSPALTLSRSHLTFSNFENGGL